MIWFLHAAAHLCVPISGDIVGREDTLCGNQDSYRPQKPPTSSIQVLEWRWSHRKLFQHCVSLTYAHHKISPRRIIQEKKFICGRTVTVHTTEWFGTTFNHDRQLDALPRTGEPMPSVPMYIIACIFSGSRTRSWPNEGWMQNLVPASYTSYTVLLIMGNISNNNN